MSPIFESMGVDNNKNCAHNVNKMIAENLQTTSNKIDKTTQGGNLSTKCRELMATISSRKLIHRKKNTCNF